MAEDHQSKSNIRVRQVTSNGRILYDARELLKATKAQRHLMAKTQYVFPLVPIKEMKRTG